MGIQEINDEDNEIYVCITHQRLCPCEEGENHLISNWNTDIKKILSLMETKDGNYS